MASLRQIRQRIRSTQGTKQIMRAMQLVSGSKLKRAQAKLFQARAVLEFLDGLLERVVAAQQIRNAQRRKDKKRTQPLEHPLSLAREGLPTLLVLLTSDAGLCGSYNTNVIQLAESYLRRDSAQRTHVVYIGKKGHRYFTKRGVPSAESYLDLAGRPNISKADEIGRALMRRFLDGGVGSVQLLYSQFRSATTYRPTVVQWLPIEIRPPSTVHRPQQDYIFEPSPERIFEDLLPRWAVATFQRVMLEAFTSEHSARMIAMKNATDNAEELLKSLTMQRNKIRQAAITKELSEIVGTAEALK